MQQHNGTAAPPSADSMARALEEYLAAAEAGTAPPREEFLARYPELADDLDACLAALRFIGRAAEGPRSVAADIAAVQPPEQATGQLGDYRILREVGRGGMGVIYEAEQVSLGRRVALKVLPFAATMDPRQLQRFHNEARAAASLDHPHIVPVHGVGCERGVHYYAMKFIDGQTLAELVGRQRGGTPADTVDLTHAPSNPAVPPSPAAETTPGRAADTSTAPRSAPAYRRAAEWIAQAAEALEYAHQMGIVHRDIKPANLMLDGQAQLWVTDFGLARVGSDSGVTMTGDVLGTLRYMSPEQALAKHGLVDHRTDIYSLGATLYELLTLRPTVDGKDREEVLRKITFDEPAVPRSVDRGIPADLETVVLKALAKEPGERYATAREFADDLRRYLGNQPILARRPTWTQRGVKWTQRHQRLVGAVFVLILLACAGLATSTALILAAQSRTDDALKDANDQRYLADKREARAREEEARAKEQKSRAEDNLKTALRMVMTLDDILSNVSNRPQEPITPERIAELADQVIKVLEKVREDHLNDPVYFLRLAAAHDALARSLENLGRITEAEAAFAQCQTIYAGLVAAFPTSVQGRAAQIAAPALRKNLAEIQRAQGRLAEAEENYSQAIAIMDAVIARQGTPRGVPSLKGLQAVYRCGLARCLLAAGRIKEAEDEYRKAMQLLPNWREILLGHLTEVRISWAWFLVTRPDAEHRDPAEAIQVVKPMVRPVAADPHARNVLGVAQYRLGDWTSAVATLNEVVPSQRGHDNGVGFFLAMAYFRLGEKDKAWRAYRDAIAWTRENRPKDEELRRFHAEAALVLGANDQTELAEQWIEKLRYVAAARCYAALFAAEPKLAKDGSPTHRAIAAGAAARAGCGRGDEAASLSENERAELRAQALDWLRTDLALTVKQLDASPRSAAEVRKVMEDWQSIPSFTVVRDREALAKLPEAERQQWQKLWADVAATLARAQQRSTPPEKPFDETTNPRDN